LHLPAKAQLFLVIVAGGWPLVGRGVHQAPFFANANQSHLELLATAQALEAGL